MRVWTYLRPFEYRGLDCVVEVTLTLKETISRLFIDNELVDEQSLVYSAGGTTFVHPLPRRVVSGREVPGRAVPSRRD